MSRSVLDIVIKLSKQGGADRETVKGLVQVKSSLGQLAAIAGVATGALYTAKKAFDFAKEGAQLQFVEQRFNRLAGSIGANAGLMGDLREVTRGLYSDTELMASASDLMGLGLAKNSDELLRLAKVSSGLNMNMNQLVLTLTNMTTMRFDALGVSVDGFKEKVKGLEDAGMDANTAFKEAFLQQAEAQLDKVGEAADSTAGSFMRLEAGIKNMADSAKKNFATAVEPMIRALADQVDAGAEQSRIQEENAFYNDLAKQSIQNLTGQVNVAYSQAQAYAVQLKENVQATMSWDQALMNSQVTVASATATTFDFAASMDELDALMGGRLGKSFDDYQQSLGELNTELADLQAQQDRFPENSRKWNELGTQIDDVNAKIKATTESYREQAAAISFSISQAQVQSAVELDPTKAQEGAQILSELAYGYGLVDERQKALTDSTSVLLGKWAEGNSTVPATVAGLEALGSIYSEVDLTTSNAGANMKDAASNAEALGAEINKAGSQAEESSAGVALTNEQLNILNTLALNSSKQVNGLRGQVAKLDGMTATAVINIIVNGAVPNLGRATGRGAIQGGGSPTAGRPGFHGHAAGGTLGPSNIVGEQGWEAVIQGKDGRYTVIPHETSMELFRLGLLGGAKGLRGGGHTGFSGFGTGFGVGGVNSTATRRPRQLDSEVVRQTSGGGGGGNRQTNNAPAPTVQETVTPLVETTQEAVASVEAAQVQQSVEARMSRADMQRHNNVLAGKLDELIGLQRTGQASMTSSMKAAIQQIMG